MGGRGSFGQSSGKITKQSANQTFNQALREQKSVQGLGKQKLKEGYLDVDNNTSGVLKHI